MISSVLIITCIGVAVFLLLFMVKEGYSNRVVKQFIEFDDFPQGQMRVFFISDIHNRQVTDLLLSQINEKVDIVVIGGDITDKRVPFKKVEHNIKALQSLAPVYFVWGNNDYEVDYKYLDAMLLEYGVTILDNTAVEFEFEDGGKVLLLGIDDMTYRRDRIDLALQDADQYGEGFRILVSHNPRAIRKINPKDRIRLLLSGHTHGGQIRLLGWGLYEKGRLKKVDDVMQLISNGFGTTKLPFRLGAKSETHLITLTKSK